MRGEKTIIIIPAFNEERHIQNSVKHALSLVKSGLAQEFVVIDDGSTDRTAQIAKEAGATMIRSGRNLGKGGAFILGALHCRQMLADTMVMIDADLIVPVGNPVQDMLDLLHSKDHLPAQNGQHGPYNMVVAAASEGNARPDYTYSGERAIRMKSLCFLFAAGEDGKLHLAKSKPAERFIEMCGGFGLEPALDWQIRPSAVLPVSEGIFKLHEAFRKGKDAQVARQMAVESFAMNRHKTAEFLKKQAAGAHRMAKLM